jgi:hypothetical protein
LDRPIPRFDGDPLHDLKIVGERDGDGAIVEACERAVIPSLTAAETMAVNIERHTGNENDEPIGVFGVEEIGSGRL